MRNGVAISGKAGSGKSTFASSLVGVLKDQGIEAQQLAFADPIKQEVGEIYGLYKGDSGWRDAIHQHGAYRRETEASYWMGKLRERVQGLRARGILPVLDDLRLETEHEWARQEGFLLVRIEASPKVRAARLKSLGLESETAYSTYRNEVELDKASFDLKIRNEGKRGELEKAGLEVIRRLNA